MEVTMLSTGVFQESPSNVNVNILWGVNSEDVIIPITIRDNNSIFQILHIYKASVSTLDGLNSGAYALLPNGSRFFLDTNPATIFKKGGKLGYQDGSWITGDDHPVLGDIATILDLLNGEEI
jgi:hypothetical protein